MIPTALFNILKTLVSNRCYPIKLPEEVTFPALTYFQVSGSDGSTHGGFDHTVQARWQVSCWGKTYADTRVLAEAVKLALRAFAGDGIEEVKKSTIENETDMYEADTEIYHIPIDFMLFIIT
jgi:hypothetical protein